MALGARNLVSWAFRMPLSDAGVGRSRTPRLVSTLMTASLIELWCSANTERVTWLPIGHGFCLDPAKPLVRFLNTPVDFDA